MGLDRRGLRIGVASCPAMVADHKRIQIAIVENGLDVANANTIIVYNADHFGLSQLYQMRGRVGRSHHMAFAYFVYQADKILTETAEKRLQAMKEFAELGAGFKIAMRDLEIRGAGNLLGAQIGRAHV